MINYNILIKAKNADWYESAKEFGSIKEWEQWNDGKMPRYVREVFFKFMFPVLSIEVQEKSNHEFEFFNSQKESVKLLIPDLRIITFKGEVTEAKVFVSESILEQSFIEKNKKNKTYVYCYIKENAEYDEMCDSLWLSIPHRLLMNEVIAKGFDIFGTYQTKFLGGSGLLAVEPPPWFVERVKSCQP
jgi:hypothetical protein